MPTAQDGDRVRVHYTGRLADGTTFDSSRDREPLEFRIGERAVIVGFENAVRGMELAESKTVELPAADAYGPYDEEQRVEVPRARVPDGLELELEPGQRVQIGDPNGKSAVVAVLEVTEETVVLDGNHPLAGKDLTFELELVEILSD